MPRIARIIAAEYPHHITQRGNNRCRVFFDDEDRETYLQLLARNVEKYHVQVLAYCLMDTHVHLLAVPETETALSRGIGLTNLMYTQYFNRKLKQSGRIWQNRFFSCVVGNDRYLWAVARYIEQNPVKAGLTRSPEEYRWSSAKAHMIGATDQLLHTESWLPPLERDTYAEFVRIEDEERDKAIRRATSSGRPFASEQFIGSLELRLKQSLKPGKPGRPRKNMGSVPY